MRIRVVPVCFVLNGGSNHLRRVRRITESYYFDVETSTLNFRSFPWKRGQGCPWKSISPTCIFRCFSTKAFYRLWLIETLISSFSLILIKFDRRLIENWSKKLHLFSFQETNEIFVLRMFLVSSIWQRFFREGIFEFYFIFHRRTADFNTVKYSYFT